MKKPFKKLFGPLATSLLLMMLLLMLGWNASVFAADPKKGSKTYAAHCKNCHGSQGTPLIPGASDFSRGEGLLQPDAALLTTISSGKGIMPAFKALLSHEEILDVIAHIRTLQR